MSKAAQVMALPKPASAPAPGAHPARKGFDFSVISDLDTRARVILHVQRIHMSMRRTAYEIVEIGRCLGQLRDSLQGRFERLCRDEFGIDPRVARRFIDTARYVDVELVPSNANLLDHVTPTVLYRLAQGEVSAQVVEEALREAGASGKVSSRELRAAIDRVAEQVEEKDRELHSAAAEIAAARTALAEATARSERAELQASRLKGEHERLAANLHRAQEEIADYTKEHAELQEQIRGLKERPPAAKEIEVPKIPAGYTSLEQALGAKEKELREIDQRLAGATERLAKAGREFAALQDKAALRQSSLDLLVGFRTDIQALSAKYLEVLAAAASGDPRLAAECSKIAAGLRLLADHLDARTAAYRRAAA